MSHHRKPATRRFLLTLTRVTLLCLAVAGVFLASAVRAQPLASSPAPAEADWTLMIFMNGKNNLEQDALDNFRQLAGVGPSEQVKVAIMMGRLGDAVSDEPAWSGTHRFLLRKGMTSSEEDSWDAAQAVKPGSEWINADMGDVQTLVRFVQWAKAAAPAKHYMLELWDHGDGWRVKAQDYLAKVELSGIRAQFDATALQFNKLTANLRLPDQPPVTTLQPDLSALEATLEQFKLNQTPSPVMRGISDDEATGHHIYNCDLQAALPGLGVDVICFDACLMSMVETGYALRQAVPVMVGSEELIPAAGWHYKLLLQRLNAAPPATAAEFGKVAVACYGDLYQDTSRTTLSVVDLTRMDPLATAVSALADRLIVVLGQEANGIKKARLACRDFGRNAFQSGDDHFYHVDLGFFCRQLEAFVQDAQVKTLSKAVRDEIARAVSANYASPDAQKYSGATGLAIYFAPSRAAYRHDPYAGKGYEKNNTDKPVEFVKTQRWSDFLHAYFDKVTQ